MTCILGLVQDGAVWMGGDSVAISGWDAKTVVEPKIFMREPFLIGYTTSFRMGQILKYELAIPSRGHEEGCMDYLIRVFAHDVRKVFDDVGFLKKKDDHEVEGGQFLVGYEGHLFEVGSDFQVMEWAGSMAAIGAGQAYATGAAAALASLPPGDRIHQALEIAERYCATVRGPFHILALPGVAEAS